MPNSSERPFADILDDIVGNVQGIIRSEVRLAKTEVREQAVRAGKASGIVGGGTLIALYAGGFLFLTALYALEFVLAPWLAALVLALVLGGAAAVLIRTGLKRMKQVHARPEQTIESLKENFVWAKNQTK